MIILTFQHFSFPPAHDLFLLCIYSDVPDYLPNYRRRMKGLKVKKSVLSAAAGQRAAGS